MLHKYLQDLQETSGISRRDIADRSGVPRSTVDRILSGESDDPKFQNVVDIVMAMGGSLDELVGITQDEPESVQNEDPVKVLATTTEASKESIQPCCSAASKCDRIRQYRCYVRILFIACCVLVAFIMVMVILDSFLPGVGWIRG